MSRSLASSASAGWRRTVIAAALAVAALVAGTLAANPAHAGTYTIHSCANGAVHGWSGATNHGGMTQFAICPEAGAPSSNKGLTARHAVQRGGSTVPWLSAAWIKFDAPAGAVIDKIDWFGGSKINGSPGTVWRTGIYDGGTGSAIWEIGGVDGSGYAASDGWRSLDTWNGSVKFQTVCTSASCLTNSGEDDGVMATINAWDVRLDITDGGGPHLHSGRGNLWTHDGWMSGDQSVGFNADDNVGVKRAWIDVDGTLVKESNSGSDGCSYDRPVPCPGRGVDHSLNTGGLSDGAHTVALRADDTANNNSTVSHTFRVDNNAPGATGTPSLGGGRQASNWYNANGYALSFSTPGTGGGSPNQDGAVELCRYDNTGSQIAGSCQVVAINAADGNETVSLPQDGIYRAKFRVNDALHTGAWGSESPTLRLDRQAPAAASQVELDSTDSSEWSNDPSYRINWNAPAPGLSPENLGDYELCRAHPTTGVVDTAQCRTGSVVGNSGTRTLSIDDGNDATVDNGAWRFRLRVGDTAGNTGAFSEWSSIIRYDATVPARAAATSFNGWLSKPEAEEFIVRRNQTQQLPLSDIAGYNVAFDAATPGNTVTHVASKQDISRPAKVNLAGLSEGVHRVKARAITGAGTAAPDDQIEDKEVRLDLSGPVVDIDGHPSSDKPVNKPVTLRISASDALSGMARAADGDPVTNGAFIEYAIDGGAPLRVRGDKATVVVDTDGEHTVRYRAYDLAGNPSQGGQSGMRSVTFTVDQEPTDGGMLPQDPNNPRLIRFYVTETCLESFSIQVQPPGGEWRPLETKREGQILSATIPDNLWEKRESLGIRLVVTDCAGNTTIIDKWWQGQNAGQPIGTVNLAARIRTVLRMALSQDELEQTACVPTKKTVVEKVPVKKTKKSRKAKKRNAAKAGTAIAAAKKKAAKKKPRTRTRTRVVTVLVCPDGRVIAPSSKRLGVEKAKKAKKAKKRKKRSSATARKASVEALAAAKKRKAKKKAVRKGKRGVGGPTAELTATEDQPKVVYGFLTTADGVVIPNAAVDVEVRIKGSDTWERIATDRTNEGGQIAAKVPAGPSRSIRLTYQRTEWLETSHSNDVGVKVAASSTIRAMRSSARNGQTVRFAGRVVGGFLPPNGRELELQGWSPFKKAWIPVRTQGLRTDANGNWTASYRFTATVGQVTYPFRLRIAPRPDHPFEEGFSRAVDVTVVGGRVTKVSKPKKAKRKAGRKAKRS